MSTEDGNSVDSKLDDSLGERADSVTVSSASDIDEPGNDRKLRWLIGSYLGYSVIYSLLIVFCGVLSAQLVFTVAIVPVVVGIAATIILVAIWSALGPGSYFKRLFVTHLIGVLPITALILTLIYLHSYPRDTTFALKDIFPLIPLILPIIMCVQIPYLATRVFLGWQMVLNGSPRRRDFELSDMFAFTFMLGACLAVLIWSYERSLERVSDSQFRNNPPIGEQIAQVKVALEEAESSNKQREIPIFRVHLKELEAQMELQSAISDNMRNFVLRVGAATLGVAILISVLSIPILVRVFCAKETHPGRGILLLCIFGLWALLAGLFYYYIKQVPGRPPPYFMLMSIGAIGLLIFSAALGVLVPLLTSRYQGFRLVTNLRIRKQVENG